MAGKSTISITFKLDGDGKGFKDLANDADGLKKVMTATIKEAEQLKGSVINFAALATGVDAVQRTFSQLQGVMSDLAGAYAVQESNEQKLALTMRNSMDASDAQIDSIKKLCSAQQELGVIGDEVQLAGAQELSTYLGLTSSLETLIPVLNDMNAQQYGLNATTESSVTIATMLGKVMNGQVGALSRYGYSFDEAQEKILKFGTEEERCAVLADVVSASVGGMNEALAQTDSGKQKQLENALGDVKEQLGQLVGGALPFVTIAASTVTALGGVIKLTAGVKAANTAVKTWNLSNKAASAGMVVLGLRGKQTTAVVRVFSSAMKGGAYSTTAMKIALRGLMIATGVGAAIAAVTFIIEKLANASDKATESTEELNEATEAYKSASSTVKTEIDAEIKKLGGLIESHGDATDAINHLNRTYGDIFGQYKTAAAWYDVLTKKSGAYIKQIGYEAQAKILATKIAEKQIAREMNDQKRREMVNSGTAFTKSFTGQTRLSKDMKEAQKEAAKLSEEEKELNKQLEVTTGLMAAVSAEMGSIEAGNNVLTVATMNWQQVSEAITETEKKLKETTDPEKIKNLKAYNAELKAQKAILDKQLGFSTDPKQPKTKTKAAKETPVLPEKLEHVKAYGDAINYWRDVQQTASQEEYANIQKTIEALEAERDAFMGVQKEAKKVKEDNTPLWTDNASTLKGIGDNIQILNNQLQSATIDEAALINQQIAAWDKKADAIKNAGIEAEKTAIKTGEALKDGWGGIKNIGGSIEGITGALEGNGNAWQTVTGIIDGFIGLYEGIQTIVGIVNLMTAASSAHAAAKGVEATAEATEAATRTTTATTNAAASTVTIAANKLEAASWKELAASEYMAAHAYIPFAGFGIAAGFTASMLAMTAAAGIPMLADGGIASGPTLAMVGEYAGASGNPEVIAPLDKLRGMLSDPGGIDFSKVKFEIKGRTLVGIIEKENNITKRG